MGSLTNWSINNNGGYWSISFIKTDGTLWSWRYNNYGQLGQGDIIDRSSPVQVGSGTDWKYVKHGRYVLLSTKTDGTFWGCGNPVDGCLPIESSVSYSSPVQVGSDTRWVSVNIGSYITTGTCIKN